MASVELRDVTDSPIILGIVGLKFGTQGHIGVICLSSSGVLLFHQLDRLVHLLARLIQLCVQVSRHDQLRM